jgi:hypothetical protein
MGLALQRERALGKEGRVSALPRKIKGGAQKCNWAELHWAKPTMGLRRVGWASAQGWPYIHRLARDEGKLLAAISESWT